MRRDKLNTIVTIGNGLCRVITRNEKLARKLAALPNVQLRENDETNLGWWLIFPEEMRPLIAPVFTKREPPVQGGSKRLRQASLFDDMRDHPDGDLLWQAGRGDIGNDTDDLDSEEE